MNWQYEATETGGKYSIGKPYYNTCVIYRGKYPGEEIDIYAYERASHIYRITQIHIRNGRLALENNITKNLDINIIIPVRGANLLHKRIKELNSLPHKIRRILNEALPFDLNN